MAQIYVALPILIFFSKFFRDLTLSEHRNLLANIGIE